MLPQPSPSTPKPASSPSNRTPHHRQRRSPKTPSSSRRGGPGSTNTIFAAGAPYSLLFHLPRNSPSITMAAPLILPLKQSPVTGYNNATSRSSQYARQKPPINGDRKWVSSASGPTLQPGSDSSSPSASSLHQPSSTSTAPSGPTAGPSAPSSSSSAENHAVKRKATVSKPHPLPSLPRSKSSLSPALLFYSLLSRAALYPTSPISK